MKKLISFLLIAFTCIGYNLAVNYTPSTPYTPDSSYVGRSHSETDYKKLYESYVADSAERADGCDLKQVKYSGLASLETTIGGFYWLAPTTSKSVPESGGGIKKKKPYMIHCEDGAPLIAPSWCRIEESANASQKGTKMVLTINDQYKLTFTDLGRWYCCRKRKPSLKKNARATFTHTEDAKGVKLRPGDIFAYGTTDTCVEVEVRDEDGAWVPASLSQFYTE